MVDNEKLVYLVGWIQMMWLRGTLFASMDPMFGSDPRHTGNPKGYAKKKTATRGCFIWLRPPRHPPPSPMLPKKEIINHVFGLQ